MRYREFKLAEKVEQPLGNPNQQPAKVPSKDRAETADLKMGPPFPPEQMARVKDMQTKLEKIGYSVGSTGIDGKFGPRTSAALAAFIKDYKLQGNSNTFDANLTDNLDKVVSGAIPRVKNPTPVAAAGPSQLPPLSQDSATQGKVGEVLNLIARYESRGNYNIILGGQVVPELTQMTLAQVYDFQRNMVRGGKESSAVGRYQYIRSSLEMVANQMGLDPNKTVFDPKTQDAIAIYDLRRRAKMDSWLNGQLSDEQFLNNVAKIWAGIPTVSGGSYYAGVGSNRAGTTAQSALATLQNIKLGTSSVTA